jgi:hypothetical protein
MPGRWSAFVRFFRVLSVLTCRAKPGTTHTLGSIDYSEAGSKWRLARRVLFRARAQTGTRNNPGRLGTTIRAFDTRGLSRGLHGSLFESQSPARCPFFPVRTGIARHSARYVRASAMAAWIMSEKYDPHRAFWPCSAQSLFCLPHAL